MDEGNQDDDLDVSASAKGTSAASVTNPCSSHSVGPAGQKRTRSSSSFTGENGNTPESFYPSRKRRRYE